MSKQTQSIPVVSLQTIDGLVEIHLVIETIKTVGESRTVGAFKTYSNPESVVFKYKDENKKEIFVDNDRYIYSHIIPYLKGEIEEFDDYQMDEWFSYHKNILNEIIILFAEAMEIGFLKYDSILVNIKELILKERRARYDHIWNR